MLICFFGWTSIPTRAQKEATDDIANFVEHNQICQAQNVIYKGTQLLLCSDGNMLLVQLQMLEPNLQMRILMGGLTISIDPTGKKKEKYSFVFPAGNSEVDRMLNMQNQEERFGSQMSSDSDSHDRPDLMPLLQALNAQGALFQIKGKTEKVGTNRFTIEANPSQGMVVYSCLIPLEPFLSEKKIKDVWTIGIYSGNNRPAPSDFPNSDMGGSPVPNGLPNHGSEAEADLLAILQNDIECWTSFSISEISSLNE